MIYMYIHTHVHDHWILCNCDFYVSIVNFRKNWIDFNMIVIWFDVNYFLKPSDVKHKYSNSSGICYFILGFSPFYCFIIHVLGVRKLECAFLIWSKLYSHACMQSIDWAALHESSYQNFIYLNLEIGISFYNSDIFLFFLISRSVAIWNVYSKLIINSF